MTPQRRQWLSVGTLLLVLVGLWWVGWASPRLEELEQIRKSIDGERRLLGAEEQLLARRSSILEAARHRQVRTDATGPVDLVRVITETLPRNVRLVRIQPSVRSGMTGSARTVQTEVVGRLPAVVEAAFALSRSGGGIVVDELRLRSSGTDAGEMALSVTASVRTPQGESR
jgi:hypothetical protein